MVRFFGVEVPFEQVRRNLSHLALVRAIFLHPDTANQSQLFHQALDSLVVELEAALVQLHCDPAVAIASLVSWYMAVISAFAALYLSTLPIRFK